MATQYTKEQLENIYEKLPEELQEAVFSVETSQDIVETGERYGVIDERLNTIAERVGFVLMGLILPQEFSEVIEKETGLPKTVAEAIARDLNRTIFYPVRPALEQLHRMEIEVSARVVTPKAGEEGEVAQEEPSQQTPPKKPSGPDAYQEPIEEP